MQASLTAAVRRACRAHAASVRPREACGVLGCPRSDHGSSIRLVRYLPLTNRAATADHFELDPVEVARAEARLRAVGLRIGGVFHSHPDAGPSPSTRDLEGAWPELVQLILGQEQPGGDAVFAAWRYHQGVATMLLLD